MPVLWSLHTGLPTVYCALIRILLVKCFTKCGGMARFRICPSAGASTFHPLLLFQTATSKSKGENCDRCFMMLLSPSAVTRVKFQCQFYAQCFKGLSGDAEGIAGIENLTLDEQSLELELQSAIEAENYARAAKLRDELQLLQKDNRAGVLAANARFYRAFEKGDLSAMQMIWSKGDNVHCVHPGAGCISGYDLVMESWELTFGPELDLPLQIELQNVEVHIKGKLGFVTCLELIRTSGNNWGKQVATNVFENVDGSWYICLHHASYVSS